MSAPPDRAGRYRALEIVLFAMHVLAYVAALLLVLGPGKAIAFFAVHQAVFGLYMGCSFAPNHKGMPTIAPGRQIDFLRRQVLTSRNVRGGWFTDFAARRAELPGRAPPVPEHAAREPAQGAGGRARVLRGTPDHYTETSLFGSYAMVLRYLHALGAPLRRPASSAG